MITSNQAALLVAFTIIGDQIFFMASNLARIAHQDAWIGSMLGSLTGLLMTALYLILASRHPQEDFVQYSRVVAGKWIGGLIGLLYAYFFLQLVTYVLREFGEFIAATIMPETPISALLLFLLLISAWSVRNGPDVIARSAEFLVFYFLLLMFPLLLTIPEMEPSALFPILERGIWPVIQASPGPASWFGESMLILILFPLIADKRKAPRSILLAVAWSGILVSGINFLLVASLGYEVLTEQQFPFVTAARLISIGGFWERLDVIIVALWTIGDFVKLSTLYYVGVAAFARWFGLSDYRPLVLPLGAIIMLFAISQFDSMNEIHFFGATVFPRFGLTMELGIPLTILAIDIIRRRKETP